MVFLLWSEKLDPGADVPPRHGPSSQRWKPSLEASVLGLNSEVGGRVKVRVMVRLCGDEVRLSTPLEGSI